MVSKSQRWFTVDSRRVRALEVADWDAYGDSALPAYYALQHYQHVSDCVVHRSFKTNYDTHDSDTTGTHVELMRMIHICMNSQTLWQSVFPDNGSLLTARAVGACRPQAAEFPGPTLGGPKLDTLAAIARRGKSTIPYRRQSEPRCWGHLIAARRNLSMKPHDEALPNRNIDSTFRFSEQFGRISSQTLLRCCG